MDRVCGVGGSAAARLSFFVRVCLCRIARSSLAVRKLVADSRSTPPFRFTCLERRGSPWSTGRATQEIPGPPSRPRWYPNRISHPLHAGGSERALSGCFCHCLLVSQCVSLCQILARKPNLTPAAKPLSGFPPAELKLSLPSTALQALQLHPRFVKPIRPSGPPWRITQSA